MMHRARGHHDDRDDRHRHHDHRHRDDDRRHQHHHASPSGRAQQSQQSRHRDLADHRADLRLFKPSVPPPATPSSQISPVSEALTRLGSQLSAADEDMRRSTLSYDSGASRTEPRLQHLESELDAMRGELGRAMAQLHALQTGGGNTRAAAADSTEQLRSAREQLEAMRLREVMFVGELRAFTQI